MFYIFVVFILNFDLWVFSMGEKSAQLGVF